MGLQAVMLQRDVCVGVWVLFALPLACLEGSWAVCNHVLCSRTVRERSLSVRNRSQYPLNHLNFHLAAPLPCMEGSFLVSSPGMEAVCPLAAIVW